MEQYVLTNRNSKMKNILFCFLIFICSCCNIKNYNVDCCNDKIGSYPVISNEMLQKNIIEYVDKYNNKENESLRNLVSVNKTIKGDTALYMIANACINSLLWKRVNLMTKVEDIYVGYYDEQINDVRMTIEGVVNFMVEDYHPFLKINYVEYKKRLKVSKDYAYQIAAFGGWILEGEAYILKFVDEKIVEKIVFLQIGGIISVEKFE